jgi:hypothetical protein
MLKLILKAQCDGGMDMIQNRDKWRDFMKMVMNFRGISCISGRLFSMVVI